MPFLKRQGNLFWMKGLDCSGIDVGNFLPTSVTVKPLCASVVQMRCIR